VAAVIGVVIAVVFVGSAIAGFFAARAGNPLTVAPPSAKTIEGCADAATAT
jgi:hypothetical protein